MDPKTAETIMNEALPLRSRRYIFSAFENAFEAYRQFMANNLKFFDTDGQTNVNSRILRYAIDRSFIKLNSAPKYPFVSEMRSVNNFKYKVVHIFANNVLMNISKTSKYNKIPDASAYRVKYANNNQDFNQQITIFNTSNGQHFGQEPYYLIITYGVNEDELTHLSLMMPDEDMKKYYHIIDIKNEIVVINTEKEKNKEKKVASIKEELIKKFIKDVDHEKQ
ncbi:hypothetical protein [Petroclostridium sp. X23]|uniref:hypothetical protein n=1 Tax=Petroclostridium sp. X23 TaxID=3045146 RepID=UPI0024ADB3D2|nr:hypothetical protein [Petroclostridium sp. X23]WHH59190.1 hypothetical protein QKW49_00010 [Petroclostridium sp. X23]